MSGPGTVSTSARVAIASSTPSFGSGVWADSGYTGMLVG